MSMNSGNPFRDLLFIRERVNRLFEDALGAASGVPEPASGGVWSPAVDICETETEFLVKAEVPEVLRSDIAIWVRGNTLTIEGERKPRRIVSEGFHMLERSYGRFQRAFLLPGPVHQDTVVVSLKDGILEIVLPKQEGPEHAQAEVTG